MMRFGDVLKKIYSVDNMLICLPIVLVLTILTYFSMKWEIKNKK